MIFPGMLHNNEASQGLRSIYMKKIGLISIFPFLLISLGIFYWFSVAEGVSAQIDDAERKRRMDHDKSITDEKLERVRQESAGIQDAIAKLVANHLPKYKIQSRSFSDPATAGVGRKGQTGFDIVWKRNDSRVMITATFFFNPEEAAERHTIGTSHISMGDFFPAPEMFGKEAIIVKNVQFNKSVTDVGLHFVKGRMNISAYIKNDFRKNPVNEKELIEFVRTIEPLLVAKENFDDF